MDVTILLQVMQLAGDRLEKSDEMDVTKGSDGKQGNVPAKRNVPLFHENELNAYKQSPASKSKRRRWGVRGDAYVRRG